MVSDLDPLLTRLDRLKTRLDAARPLTSAQLQQALESSGVVGRSRTSSLLRRDGRTDDQGHFLSSQGNWGTLLSSRRQYDLR